MEGEFLFSFEFRGKLETAQPAERIPAEASTPSASDGTQVDLVKKDGVESPTLDPDVLNRRSSDIAFKISTELRKAVPGTSSNVQIRFEESSLVWIGVAAYFAAASGVDATAKFYRYTQSVLAQAVDRVIAEETGTPLSDVGGKTQVPEDDDETGLGEGASGSIGTVLGLALVSLAFSIAAIWLALG